MHDSISAQKLCILSLLEHPASSLEPPMASSDACPEVQVLHVVDLQIRAPVSIGNISY